MRYVLAILLFVCPASAQVFPSVVDDKGTSDNLYYLYELVYKAINGGLSGTYITTTAGFSGDVTGPYNATVVGDNSHLHNMSSIQNVLSSTTTIPSNLVYLSTVTTALDGKVDLTETSSVTINNNLLVGGKIDISTSMAEYVATWSNGSYDSLSGGLYVTTKQGPAVKGYSAVGYGGYFTHGYSTGTALAVETGKVGIGDTSPEYTLDVEGDGYFASSVTASAFHGSGSNLAGVVKSLVGYRASTDTVSLALINISTITARLDNLDTSTLTITGRLDSLDTSTLTITTALSGKVDLTETSSVTFKHGSFSLKGTIFSCDDENLTCSFGNTIVGSITGTASSVPGGLTTNTNFVGDVTGTSGATVVGNDSHAHGKGTIDLTSIRYSTDPVSTSLVDFSTITTQLNLKLTSATVPANFINLSTITTQLDLKLTSATIPTNFIDLSTITTQLNLKLTSATIPSNFVDLSTITTALADKVDLTETSSVTINNLLQANGLTTAGQIYSSGTANNYFSGKVLIGATDQGGSKLSLDAGSWNAVALGIRGRETNGGLDIANYEPSNILFSMTGASGQTGDLTQWKNNAAVVIASVTSTGAIYAPSFHGNGSNLTGVIKTLSGVRYSTDAVSTALIDLSTITTALSGKASTSDVVFATGTAVYSIKVASASFLAANPSACTAGQYVNDISDSGGLTCGTPSGAGDVVLAATQTFTGGNTFTGAVTVKSSVTFSNRISAEDQMWTVIYSTRGATTFSTTTINVSGYENYQIMIYALLNVDSGDLVLRINSVSGASYRFTKGGAYVNTGVAWATSPQGGASSATYFPLTTRDFNTEQRYMGEFHITDYADWQTMGGNATFISGAQFGGFGISGGSNITTPITSFNIYKTGAGNVTMLQIIVLGL